MQTVKTKLRRYADRIASSTPISMPIHRLLRIFGCWHSKMGPPFTRDNETYCTCSICGARRHFNVARGTMTGSYYYPPPSDLYVHALPQRFTRREEQ